MPVPVAVVKDGAGKTVAQVVGWVNRGEAFYPMVMLNIDGTPGFFAMDELGLCDRIGFEHGSGASVFFSGAGCTGDPAVHVPAGIEHEVGDTPGGTSFGVVGPDPTLGTYKVYRSTGSPQLLSISSIWMNGGCLDVSESVLLAPAEEVVPSPLAGFVGPTTAEPDRSWTIEGGTVINPPSP